VSVTYEKSTDIITYGFKIKHKVRFEGIPDGHVSMVPFETITFVKLNMKSPADSSVDIQVKEVGFLPPVFGLGPPEEHDQVPANCRVTPSS
jgi:hypothetical protein